MRYPICAVLLLTACTAGNPLYVGEGDGGGGTRSDGGGSASDGGGRDQAACPPSCNDDLSPRDFAQEPSDLTPAPPDLMEHQCTPTCNGCFGGGACCPGAPSGGCCRAGEWCENGTTCRCGDGPACTTSNDRCAQGGIIQFGMCGTICCGSFNHPCPL